MLPQGFPALLSSLFTQNEFGSNDKEQLHWTSSLVINVCKTRWKGKMRQGIPHYVASPFQNKLARINFDQKQKSEAITAIALAERFGSPFLEADI